MWRQIYCKRGRFCTHCRATQYILIEYDSKWSPISGKWSIFRAFLVIIAVVSQTFRSTVYGHLFDHVLSKHTLYINATVKPVDMWEDEMWMLWLSSWYSNTSAYDHNTMGICKCIHKFAQLWLLNWCAVQSCSALVLKKVIKLGI